MFENHPSASNPEPLIRLERVSKRFTLRSDRDRSFQSQFIRIFNPRNAPERSRTSFWALRDISLEVYPGESVGIIGPNGSGKSTLLKVLSGILEPTEGKSQVKARIASLLELGAGFHPDLTGRENIYLNGSVHGLSHRQIDERLDAIIDFAELGDFIDMPVNHYSSGMYVRLGFAVAIHTDPDVLLVDEVLTVGDASFQHKCMARIHDFRVRGGTLVLVAHDLGAIQSQCDRAIWLEHGEIQAEGHPTEVVMAYLNRVAEKEESKTEREELPELPEGQRWGTGRIRVNQVELCDGRGRQRKTFVTQSEMLIRLHYEAKERIEAPIFGLAIHHQNGAHVTGPNTKFGNLFIPVMEGKGCLTYHVPSLPLLEGGYQLSIAVIDQADTEMFDYHDRAYSFQIYPGQSQERYGLVTFNGHWMWSTAEEEAEEKEGETGALYLTR